MIAPILIPLAILGGMDGVETLRASVSLCEKPTLKEIVLLREELRMSYAAAARVLGVDVGHLWRVVHGERVSKRGDDGLAPGLEEIQDGVSHGESVSQKQDGGK